MIGGPLPFVYEVAEIGAAAPDERLIVNWDDALPLTVGTLSATGGIGNLRFEVATDERRVATVGRDDGVLMVTAFLGSRETATVSVRVRDGTPVNVATVAVTVFFAVPLSLSRASVAYVVSPEFVGVVHSLTATGGVGDYRYEKVAGDAVLTVDAEGAVSLTMALPEGGRATAVFAVGDEIGGSVRLSLGVVSSGEYGEAMYVVGGFFGNKYVNDVWRSVDGTNWTQVFSGGKFSGRSGHQAVSYGGSLWVIGGSGDGQGKNDVWRSGDGVNWDLVAVSGEHFERHWHQAVSYRGSLWVIGGSGRSDVWRSGDGENWVSVAVSGEHFSGRYGHQAVSYGGSLWVIGGQYRNDIWRSGDGENWVSVAVSGEHFSGRNWHQAVSYRGSLWVIGGRDGSQNNKNDVWRSADGENWVSAAVSGGHFSARYGHQAVSYRGSLWVIGGSGGQLKNDIWRSGDGENWDLEAVSGEHFSARYDYQVVVFDPGRYSYEVAPVVAEPVAVQTIFVEDKVTPLTLLTLEATGGSDTLRYELVADEYGVLSVGADGVLVVTNFVPGYVTATVRVKDSTLVNYAMVAVTMGHVFSMSLASAGYVFSPGYVGAVHSLTAGGGLGSYSYERVAGPAAVSVDARTGIVSLVSALPAGGRELAVFEVRDEIGGSARSTLSLSIADSSEDYSMEMMFLVGGRDSDVLRNGESDVVWYSVDGENWVEAPASRSLGPLEGHQVVSHGGSLWLVGGHDGQRWKNDVWRSGDGVNWELATVSAAFSGRYFHQVVSHGGSLWLVGGGGWEQRA